MADAGTPTSEASTPSTIKTAPPEPPDPGPNISVTAFTTSLSWIGNESNACLSSLMMSAFSVASRLSGPCEFVAVTSSCNQASGNTRSEEHTLNSSHPSISYAVFCLKKKKKKKKIIKSKKKKKKKEKNKRKGKKE